MRKHVCMVQSEGDRLTAERIMLHKSRADMAAQLARLKAIQVSTNIGLPMIVALCRGMIYAASYADYQLSAVLPVIVARTSLLKIPL